MLLMVVPTGRALASKLLVRDPQNLLQAQLMISCDHADTEDWRLGDPSLGETEASIMANFNRFLNLSLGLPSGFIVLAHDLYPVSEREESTCCRS